MHTYTCTKSKTMKINLKYLKKKKKQFHGYMQSKNITNFFCPIFVFYIPYKSHRYFSKSKWKKGGIDRYLLCGSWWTEKLSVSAEAHWWCLGNRLLPERSSGHGEVCSEKLHPPHLAKEAQDYYNSASGHRLLLLLKPQTPFLPKKDL